ncbi:hypothetical protein Tco_1046507 [Tanacetum coccineum]
MLDWGVMRYATAFVDLKWRYAPPSKGYDLYRRHSSPSFGMLLPPKDMIYSEGMLFHPLVCSSIRGIYVYSGGMLLHPLEWFFE